MLSLNSLKSARSSSLGVCRMNHDAKHPGGIFRRRPSSASTSSRLSIQSGNSGSISCPTSPRHQKHLPVIPSLSTTHLTDVLSSTSNFRDGPRHLLHRSPSASTTYNRQQSSHSYTGRLIIVCRFQFGTILVGYCSACVATWTHPYAWNLIASLYGNMSWKQNVQVLHELEPYEKMLGVIRASIWTVRKISSVFKSVS